MMLLEKYRLQLSGKRLVIVDIKQGEASAARAAEISERLAQIGGKAITSQTFTFDVSRSDLVEELRQRLAGLLEQDDCVLLACSGNRGMEGELVVAGRASGEGVRVNS